jgi:hypothetical protein
MPRTEQALPPEVAEVATQQPQQSAPELLPQTGGSFVRGPDGAPIRNTTVEQIKHDGQPE